MNSTYNASGLPVLLLASFAAARAEVTQRSPSPSLWGGALRDDLKNGYEGDYALIE